MISSSLIGVWASHRENRVLGESQVGDKMPPFDNTAVPPAEHVVQLGLTSFNAGIMLGHAPIFRELVIQRRHHSSGDFWPFCAVTIHHYRQDNWCRDFAFPMLPGGKLSLACQCLRDVLEWSVWDSLVLHEGCCWRRNGRGGYRKGGA